MRGNARHSGCFTGSTRWLSWLSWRWVFWFRAAWFSGRLRRCIGRKFDVVDKADHGHIDRRLRPADTGHGAEALGDQQHAVARAGVHRIHGHHGVAAIRTIQIQRLDHEQLAAFMTRMLLCGDHFADHARYEHTESTIPTM